MPHSSNALITRTLDMDVQPLKDVEWTEHPKPLADAMRHGRKEEVRHLIEGGANINEWDQYGKTAFMLAVEHGYGHLVCSLCSEAKVKGKLNLRHEDIWGATLLTYAAAESDPKLIEALLQQAEHKKLSKRDLESSLRVSAALGNTAVVDHLVRRISLFDKASKPDSTDGKHIDGLGRWEATLTASNSKPSSPSQALIAMVTHGYWIDTLVEQSRGELDLVVENTAGNEEGHTLIEIALDGGHDLVALKLLGCGVRVDHKKDRGGILLQALKRGELLETATVSELLVRGAPTCMPHLNDHSLTTVACDERLRSEKHAFGWLLTHACQKRARDMADAQRLFALAKLCIAPAFCEEPGTALCASVCLAKHLQAYAEKIRLENVDMSDALAAMSVDVGTATGSLIATLPEAERELLFRTASGTHFFRLASAAGLQHMLTSPAVTLHLTKRWVGPLLHAILEGEGVHRYGGGIYLAPEERAVLAALILPVLVVNLAALPLVALCPPFGRLLQSALECLGSDGINDASGRHPVTMDGIVGYVASGYSQRLKLWWRALYLLDVPILKFWLVQLCNALLLATLLLFVWCVDIRNIAPDSCFSDSMWDSLPFFPGDPVGAIARVARRLKKGASAGPHESGQTPLKEAGHISSAPYHLNVSQELAYFVVIFAFASQLVGVMRAGGSIAHTSSWASGIAAALVVLFFIFDHFNKVYDKLIDPEPGMVAVATFLQTVDISRAVLLQIPTCGPYVLMLQNMLRDLYIWLLLLGAVVVAFTAAVYAKNTIDPPTNDTCKDQHTYLAYLWMMFGVNFGGDSHISCSDVAGDHVTTWLFIVYYLFSMVLLMNMLIAMMAKTFDKIFEEQERNYNFIFARVVLSVDLDQGVVPAPLSILSVPFAALNAAHATVASLGGGLGGNALGYELAPETDDEAKEGNVVEDAVGGSKLLHSSQAKQTKATNWWNLALTRERMAHALDVLQRATTDEAQVRGEEPRATGVEARRDADGATTTGTTEKPTWFMADRNVRVYKGFEENASRLLFHVGDKFEDIEEPPIIWVVEPSGHLDFGGKPKYIETCRDHCERRSQIAEREKEKVVRRSAAATKKAQDKFDNKVSAILCAPRPLNMDVSDYMLVKSGHPKTDFSPHCTDKEKACLQNFVVDRGNGTFACIKVYPGSFDDSFKKQFNCTLATNPDLSTFHVQAVSEFEDCLRRVFGRDALHRSPLYYCQGSRTNSDTVLVGRPKQLYAFLQANPKMCDKLNIVRLCENGFEALQVYQKGEQDEYHEVRFVSFRSDVEHVVYVKNGSMKMAFMKTKVDFDTDCTLGEDITLTWDQLDAAESRSACSQRLLSNLSQRILNPQGMPLDAADDNGSPAVCRPAAASSASEPSAAADSTVAHQPPTNTPTCSAQRLPKMPNKSSSLNSVRL